MFFRQIYDRRLSQYAYLIGCQTTGHAIVIDPMRDVERYLDAARAEGLELVAAAETHIHADFLSGARELAERPGMPNMTVYLSDEGNESWRYRWKEGGNRRLLHDGDSFDIGHIHFDVLHTPGHTPEHVVFLVTDAGADRPMGLLSGDFVFVGDVGRPDLLESAAGERGAMEPAARELFRSLARFRELPPELQVWPGHGAGSACGKELGAVPTSTVGYELVANAALRAAESEDAFVSHILDGQPEPPLYFGRMKRLNRDGPPVLGKLPAPRRVRDGKLVELANATGVAVLDTRPWDQYRAAHLPGSLFTPLNTQFNTIAGSYVPEGMAVYLIVDEARLREAVVDLVHVGLDQIVGYATPDMFRDYVQRKGEVARVDEIAMSALDERRAGGAFVLDVRRASERAAEGAIPDTHNIAHTRLLERIDEVPKGANVIVHCNSGTRSAYAAGLLDRFGHHVVNVVGGVVEWKAAQSAPAK